MFSTKESQYDGRAARLSSIIARGLLRFRFPLLIGLSLVTVLLSYFAAHIRLDPGFNKAIPSNHPYMKVYRQYAGAFGSGNTLTIALMTKRGDIFTPDFLNALRKLTEDVNAIGGVDQSTTLSLFSPSATMVGVDETGFTGYRVVPADFTANVEEIAEVKRRLLRSNMIGSLVNRDLTGALLFTELVERPEQPISYSALADSLDGLRERYSSQYLSLHVVGFAEFISLFLPALLRPTPCPTLGHFPSLP